MDMGNLSWTWAGREDGGIAGQHQTLRREPYKELQDHSLRRKKGHVHILTPAKSAEKLVKNNQSMGAG